MKIRLNIDTKPYGSKEDAKREIRIISSRLRSSNSTYTIDADELQKGIEKGCSFMPSVMKGSTSDKWEGQYLFCADVDNKTKDGQMLANPLTPEEAIEAMEASGVNPLMVYRSFSNTPEWPKFRVVVCCDEFVTDREEASNCIAGLTSLFRGVDKAAVDLNRIYFGSTKDSIVLPCTNRTTSKEVLLGLYRSRVNPEWEVDTSVAVDSELGRAIEDFDLAGYIEQTTDSKRTRVSGHDRFNPCPLCGHRDDFDVTGSVFICRSASGGAKGNIINYLEAKHGFSRKEAREYFKYTILGIDRTEEYNSYREKKRYERAATRAHPVEEGDVPPYVIEERDQKGKLLRVRISPPLLAEYIRHHEKYIFVRGNAFAGVNRFWYSGGYYRFVTDDEIRGIIKGYIERYDLMLVKMRDVDEVFRQLTTDRVFHDASEINSDENVINFRNGVLHLDTMTLHPHSPDYLCTRQIPVDWEEHSWDDAPIFDKYMQHLCCGTMTKRYNPRWEEGAKKYRTLMEFLGACISNVKGYRFKKSLFMYGPGNTGKSQIKALAEYLIGAENCNPCDLKTLEARFGTSGIFNKRLIGSSDMPYMTITELNVFKQITGGDQLFAEYKGRNSFYFTYDGLSWFCMNRLPKFGGDNGQWVYDRILPVECPNVVPEALRDPVLLDRMKGEASAIVWMAITFYKDAVKRGYRFFEPEEAAVTRAEYKRTNNTFDAWFEDCCIEVAHPGSDEEASCVREWEASRNQPSCKKIYSHYASWCKRYENGFKLSYAGFKAEVESKYGRGYAMKRPSGMVFKDFCLNDASKNILTEVCYYG